MSSDIQYSFEAIGTSWVIDIYDFPNDLSKDLLLQKITQRIDQFDQTYSRFRADSLVTQISKQKGEFEFPEDSLPLFALYQKLYQETQGLVTPLIGQLISDAGYDADYSLKSKKVKSPPKWEDVMTFKDRKLVTKEPVLLDFGAAGKGYFIDIIAELLNKLSIQKFCIDAGGDILYQNSDKKPLTVGLQNPENLNEVIGTIDIKNESICGSAGNRRVWGKYHHIINPKSLESPQDILATWVVSQSCMIADGLTTALFFVDPAVLKSSFNFEYLIVYKGLEVKKSANFEAQLFLANL
jgi:FAD:protein FMN transferase